MYQIIKYSLYNDVIDHYPTMASKHLSNLYFLFYNIKPISFLESNQQISASQKISKKPTSNFSIWAFQYVAYRFCILKNDMSYLAK